jgi:diguanylate cyclase (GGDEF)-like protein
MHAIPPNLSKRAMTLRYVAALVLVGICAVAGHVLTWQLQESGRHDAAIINLSGRHRMLTMRIARDVLLLSRAVGAGEVDQASDSLSQSLGEMYQSHDRLLGLLASNGLLVRGGGQLSTTHKGIEQRLLAFLDLARHVLGERGRNRDEVDLVQRTALFLGENLDQAVAAYQAASEQRVERLLQLDVAALVFLVLVLAGAGLAIFRPLVEEVCLERETVHALNARLLRLATTDSLTGLHNRTRFMEVAPRELELSHRYAEPLSAIMLDIDHFKQVNDQHGHAAGDQVLSGLADLVRRNVRQTDHLFRWGGEEFLVLCPRAEAAEAAAVAEKLRGLAVQREFPGGLRITASFGVAELGEGESVEDLVRRADDALYEAKRAGRDRVKINPGRSGHAG